MTARTGLNSHPREFGPLLPERRRHELTERSIEVMKRSLALTNAAHPKTVESLRALLRSMNSYYSNRIEGQGTHPLDIERAMRNEYSRSAPKAP